MRLSILLTTALVLTGPLALGDEENTAQQMAKRFLTLRGNQARNAGARLSVDLARERPDNFAEAGDDLLTNLDATSVAAVYANKLRRAFGPTGNFSAMHGETIDIGGFKGEVVGGGNDSVRMRLTGPDGVERVYSASVRGSESPKLLAKTVHAQEGNTRVRLNLFSGGRMNVTKQHQLANTVVVTEREFVRGALQHSSVRYEPGKLDEDRAPGKSWAFNAGLTPMRFNHALHDEKPSQLPGVRRDGVRVRAALR